MDAMTKEQVFINSEHIGAYCDLSAGSMHYLEMGEGQPLLLIHGVGQSLYTWNKIMTRLARNYHVYAVDLLGSGYSQFDLPQEPGQEVLSLGIDSQAKWLAEFMDTMGIEKAHVMGFSSGAMYALALAQQFPDYVERMVLLCPGGLTPTMPAAVRGLDSPALGWFYKATLGRKMIFNLLSNCFFDQTLISETTINEYSAPLRGKEARNNLVEMLRDFDEEQVLAHLRDVEKDVLILWGVDDRWHEIGIAEVFQAALPQVEFALIRNCGHIIQEEKPLRLLEHAEDFFQNGILKIQEQEQELQ